MYVTSDARAIFVPTLICTLSSHLPQTAVARPLAACVTRAARREPAAEVIGRELAEAPDLDRLDGLVGSDRFPRAFEGIAARCARRALPPPSAGSVS